MGSCWDGIARLLLVLVNILFLLMGLGITVVGFVLRYGKSLYEPFLETGMNQLQNALESTDLGDFDVKKIDIGEYAIVIIVFVVVEAVGIGLLYGKPDMVKDQLKDQLSEFKGLGASDVYSLGWNIIMIQFKCCGVDSYADFESSKANWEKPGTGANAIAVTLKSPVACCKALPTGKATTEFDCAVTPTSALSNFETGCYSTIWDQSFGNTAIAVPVLVICGIIQILFIFFAIMVAKAENDKVGPV